MNKKEQEIQNIANKLKISYDEALEVYEFDHSTAKKQEEILQNLGVHNAVAVEEQPKKSTIVKVKTMKKKQEVDENKETIKKAFSEWFFNNPIFTLPQEYKNNYFGFFDKDGNFYSFKLTKHKTVQDGYKIK